MTFIFLLLQILQTNPNFHIIEKGETLYSISKMKGIPLELLMKKNQFSDSTVIGIGDTIYFPTNQELTDLNGKYIYYTVQKGETIFYISRKYDKIAFDDLMKLNNINSNYEINEGQRLIVGFTKPGSYQNPTKLSENLTIKKITNNGLVKKSINNAEIRKNEPVKNDSPLEKITQQTPKPLNSLSISPKPEKKAIIPEEKKDEAQSLFENNNQGKSTKCIASSLNSGNNFALFSGVEAGSYIRVRNVKNNRAVYLKVIGKFPNTNNQKQICLKISKSAADQLKISSPQFLVDIEY